MVRQFAVDGEIERSEAEGAAVGAAVRLATARVDMYLTVRHREQEIEENAPDRHGAKSACGREATACSAETVVSIF